MKITIDTKEDSSEDIHRVVRMLQAWLEGHTNAPMDMFGSSQPGSAGQQGAPVNEGLFNIFGDTDSSKQQATDADNNKIIDLDKNDYPEEIPQIIPY